MKTEKQFNYNDVELVKIITRKVFKEKGWEGSLGVFSFIDDNYDYSKKESEQETIEKIKIKIGMWGLLITDRKEIYVNTEHLKDRIRQEIDGERKRQNKEEEIYQRRLELEEKKKREFQENFNKLTPEMKAFFYVATALGREYLQACKNQNNYMAPNPYYNNNLLDNFLSQK
jgi:hypothetical protein